MEMTKNLDKDIAAYEKLIGDKVSTGLRKLLAELAACGDCFEALGKTDALQGREQRPEESFIKWGERELPGSHDENNPVVDLMYKCYLSGYQKGGVT